MEATMSIPKDIHSDDQQNHRQTLKSSSSNNLRKPPTAPKVQLNITGGLKKESISKGKSVHRVRSASTGRDKKSELQARYWALLFGNLQRAVNEIYQTVECYENMSSCQEAILVLENYIRDFKALAEWFRVSWDYELTPLPQRSLAWEVRKSNPVPRIRAKSLSSPIVSGKSSPNFSGKSSPCSNTEDCKNSPRKTCRSEVPRTTRVNIRELFSKKPIESVTNQNHNSAPEKDEKNLQRNGDEAKNDNQQPVLSWQDMVNEEMQLSESMHSLNHLTDIDDNNTEKRDQYAQTDLEDENLTLAEIREKMRNIEEMQLEQQELLTADNEEDDDTEVSENNEKPINDEINGNEVNENSKEEKIEENEKREPTSVELTVIQLNNLENAEMLKTPAKTTPDTELKKVEPVNVVKPEIIATNKSSDAQLKKCQNSPIKYSSVINRPATNTIAKHVTSRTSIVKNSRPGCMVQPLQKTVTPTITNGPIINSTNKKLPVKSTPNSNQHSTLRNTNITSKTSSNLVKNDKWMPPSNVANRLLSSRSRTMIDMNEKNTRQTRNQLISSGRKTSREDVYSSGSTIKASNEKISNSKSNNNDNVKTNQNLQEPSNDGWLTVKTRRRSSLHWANRFNQPTGYASLPTLSLLSEKEEQVKNGTKDKSKAKEKPQNGRLCELIKQEERPKSARTADTRNEKLKANSMPFKTQQKESVRNNKSANKNEVSSQQTIIKRQKSDLTGLKITSLHREYMRSEKYNNKKNLAKDNASKNGSESEKQETNLEDSEKDKIDIKIQTNREFSKTIGDLYESLANIPNGKNPDAGLSSCDECEERDTESDEDQRKLFEEQESLERQIRELQNTEIDVDTETDETDCEVMIDQDENNEDHTPTAVFEDDPLFVNDENISLELRYQSLLSEMSWGEREEALATLQAYVSRHPGRAQELHQKLSSPSRRRSLHETLKKYQAKQARAQQKRELLQKEKAIKIQHLLARVEDVKSAKWQLIEEKRIRMELRLQRAAENRNQYLRDIVRKAHDEEEKLKEIAFIKILEAQNKRLDFIESCKEHEGRLQDLEQERQKRLEEKAAKEAAVERRRQELEQARKRRLEKMNETRLEREQRIGKMQEQREKERQAIAREKAKDREERLLALQVQKQQNTEELQRKIIQKQKESARRHEENIEHIRQRALELTIPTRNVDETRPDNEDFNDGEMSSTVSDVSKEHTKGFKKRIKKIKQRLMQNGEEYMKDLQPLPLYMKRDSQVPKFLNLVSKGGGAQGLERQLSQLLRITAKAQINDFQCFWLMDGLGVIGNVISQGMEDNLEISKRAVVLAVQLYRNACTLCPQIARHALLGNSFLTLFDALLKTLQLPEETSPQHPVELSTEIMLACTVALSPSNSKKHTQPKVLEHIPDIISYATATGLIDVLARRCMKIRESIENYQSVILSLLATVGLLTKFADICPSGPNDQTKFLNAARSTELFGTISMLYSSVVPIGESIPPRTISLAAATFNLLVSMAVLDLTTFQEILSGDSPLSMKYLDVITVLLKYCGNQCTIKEKTETQAVIVDLIATIGFFCANNTNNQNLITSDQCSVIIKSLTKLPESFNVVIYPCLVTIIHNNDPARSIISKDFNLKFLDEYKDSEKAKKNHLVTILKSSSSSDS